MKDATDGDLVRRARAGEAAAFAELCRRHGCRARALARRILGGDAEAEDVVQDTLLTAFAGLARLREPERFGSWLCAIAVNLARMRVRARRPEPVLVRPSDALNLALRVGAPVHVAEEVLAEAATVADDITAELDDREQALGYAGGEPWRELEAREVLAAWEAQRPHSSQAESSRSRSSWSGPTVR
jgi:DNA-directed RNA polymerase specialized sigma24 family protein